MTNAECRRYSRDSTKVGTWDYLRPTPATPLFVNSTKASWAGLCLLFNTCCRYWSVAFRIKKQTSKRSAGEDIHSRARSIKLISPRLCVYWLAVACVWLSVSGGTPDEVNGSKAYAWADDAIAELELDGDGHRSNHPTCRLASDPCLIVD